MQTSRRRWRHVAVFILGAALIPASGCSDDIMTLVYYMFSSVTSVLEASLTGSTTTTTTTSSDSTTSSS